MKYDPKAFQIEGLWESCIRIGDRLVFLGIHSTKVQAINAYNRRFRRERLKLIQKLHCELQFRLSVSL